jgi:hypothetical protein
VLSFDVYQKVAVEPHKIYFGLASGVHLGRHRIGGLNYKNPAQAPQTACIFTAHRSDGLSAQNGQ